MRILTVALLLLVATTTSGQSPDLFDESLVRTIEITRLAANYASKTYLAADLAGPTAHSLRRSSSARAPTGTHGLSSGGADSQRGFAPARRAVFG